VSFSWAPGTTPAYVGSGNRDQERRCLGSCSRWNSNNAGPAAPGSAAGVYKRHVRPADSAAAFSVASQRCGDHHVGITVSFRKKSTLLCGKPGAFDGISQFRSDFSLAFDRDGFPARGNWFVPRSPKRHFVRHFRQWYAPRPNGYFLSLLVANPNGGRGEGQRLSPVWRDRVRSLRWLRPTPLPLVVKRRALGRLLTWTFAQEMTRFDQGAARVSTNAKVITTVRRI